MPNRFLNTASASCASQWLLCLAALLGVATNATANVGLRISLVTSSTSSTEAPFTAPGTAPSVAQNQATAAAQAVAKAKLREQIQALVESYAAKSDAELNALSARWQELPRLHRQVLLREAKMRMARQRGRQGVLQIRTERRFGRLLRQADGSVVRVETRVVRVRPATQGEQASQVRRRNSGYGTGYARRSAPSVPVSSATQPADSQSLPHVPPAEIGADQQP